MQQKVDKISPAITTGYTVVLQLWERPTLDALTQDSRQLWIWNPWVPYFPRETLHSGNTGPFCLRSSQRQAAWELWWPSSRATCLMWLQRSQPQAAPFKQSLSDWGTQALATQLGSHLHRREPGTTEKLSVSKSHLPVSRFFAVKLGLRTFGGLQSSLQGGNFSESQLARFP